MSRSSLPATTVKLAACFATLALLQAASVLCIAYQCSPPNWLTVAVGQKFSPPVPFFFTVPGMALASLVLTVLCAAVMAYWAHARIARPLTAATAAARRMASGDLRKINETAGVQNNELLSTMQEMNTFLFEIIAHSHNSSQSIACGASELARHGQQALLHGTLHCATVRRAAAAAQQGDSGAALTAIAAATAQLACLEEALAQAAASAAAVRDDAGQLRRALGVCRLGADPAPAALIRLAHSIPARQARAGRSAAGTPAHSAHLISIL